MTLTVAAIYENGVLLPERALPLTEHQRVEIVIHTTPPDPGDTLSNPSVEARMAALQRLLAMGLPVADWEEMEQEITRGAVE